MSMGSKDLFKPKKPEIEKKEHKVHPGKDEDIILKLGSFRIYFQNYYTIISLANDLFTGILYLTGSLVQTFTDKNRLGLYLFIFASFFLLMRPILKIIHNVFFYSQEEYEQQVLGENEDQMTEGEKPTKEVKVETKQNDSTNEEINKSYNNQYDDKKNTKE
ncbi:YrhK-like protein [Alkalibacterium gilvum]|uniref:YrhK-like protein n=2 Tax=Carnobacteriaceae TaxID=186828 RepID=A0A1H6SRI2_9LACT|nr:YrhK-like protein [Alkalibacterium gilvum]